MTTLRDINNDLLNGICPESLFFGKKEAVDPIDWEKIKYNTFYRDPNFFLGKFHKGIDKILPPEIFELMAERAQTPAEEMNLRQANLKEQEKVISDLNELDVNK